MHYEVELGLVIGKTLKDLDPEDHQGALDSISSSFSSFLPTLTRLLFWIPGAIANLVMDRLPPRNRHDSP